MKFVFLLTLALFAARARADVVASIRYFKSKGESHYHLYLFHNDGTLVRQLTTPENAQDIGPRFSADGKSILFTRKTGKHEDVAQSWEIGVDGKGLRKVDKAPAGDAPTPPAKYVAGDEELNPPWEPVEGGFRLAVPGSKLEFTHPTAELAAVGGPMQLDKDLFHTLTLTDRETGAKTSLEAGWEYFWARWMTCKGNQFFRQEGLFVALYEQHTGSTDSYRVGAVDLLGKWLISLSKNNPAEIVPHGTRPGFFSICSERYQPLPGTRLSVNCLYLDWWDKDFKRVRFSKALSLFGGASVRVKGQAQLDIPYDEEWSRGF